MMERTGPWPCLIVAVGLLVLGSVVFIFVPDNKRQHEAKDADDQTGDNSMQAVQQLHEAFSILNSTSLLILFLVALTSSPVGPSTLAFLVQYASNCFSLLIFTTGFIDRPAMAMSTWFSWCLSYPTSPRLVLGCEVLRRVPGLSNERDHDLVQAPSAAVLGLAPNLPVFCVGMLFLTAGSGYSSFTRCLISDYIEPEHRLRIFALVSMVEMLGNISSQLMLLALLSFSLELGGKWLGLP
ncbi:uncharacterized protein BCR38DRAFT_446220 [Pseudomassariella vexata]|uniref:Major facilitator superfamily domain-containing protein n=1 Tax=Pseudomassariella vexata TaxID=1141098 RepID=A0A1Y2DJ82_9PEZI|nr:uncharacterized protein BCR38DRAFT_446220 [Pseudomassariella vexata]ORY59308.1 hypothetical protein BCR38DRAFT_446220 [Pseudomassariella vexata]